MFRYDGLFECITEPLHRIISLEHLKAMDVNSDNITAALSYLYIAALYGVMIAG